MTRALELHDAPRGTTIELTLHGSRFDGTPFEAADCITIPGPGHPTPNLRPAKRPR